MFLTEQSGVRLTQVCQTCLYELGATPTHRCGRCRSRNSAPTGPGYRIAWVTPEQLRDTRRAGRLVVA